MEGLLTLPEPEFTEVGDGRVLTGMLRQIRREQKSEAERADRAPAAAGRVQKENKP